MDLFKHKPRKTEMAYRVESLNPEKGISSTMRVKGDREYVVCLCMTDKTVKTTFPTYLSASEQMKKYRALYKAKRPKF